MKTLKVNSEVKKLKTGIYGLDSLANGGLPKMRCTLVSGSSGSAKTVLAVQFLAEGIKQFNESGVFVTFEEPPADICKNMLSLGWNLRKWEKEGKLAFVDGVREFKHDIEVYDIHELIAKRLGVLD